jgi:serine/threonine protein kinase
MEELSEDGRNGIYHRDMKPSNIVINYNEKYEIVSLYLIDFGMAKITDFNKSKESTNCGSAYYIAPEVRNGAAYNEKVDIWSVGVFLYEMYIKNSKKLYSNTLMHSMNSVNDKLEDSINGVTNSDWKRWVSKVLKINAEEREKSNQIL